MYWLRTHSAIIATALGVALLVLVGVFVLYKVTSSDGGDDSTVAVTVSTTQAPPGTYKIDPPDYTVVCQENKVPGDNEAPSAVGARLSNLLAHCPISLEDGLAMIEAGNFTAQGPVDAELCASLKEQKGDTLDRTDQMAEVCPDDTAKDSLKAWWQTQYQDKARDSQPKPPDTGEAPSDTTGNVVPGAETTTTAP